MKVIQIHLETILFEVYTYNYYDTRISFTLKSIIIRPIYVVSQLCADLLLCLV